MRFQEKYYCLFRDIKEQLYRVEIWEDTESTIIPVEVTGGLPPFIVDHPTISHKFETVRGSGCDINFISDTDRQFINLYTADIQQYQIRFHRVTGSVSELIWCGFLDTELYREPFQELKNYVVPLAGTDGFALLERINYLTGSNIVTVKGPWVAEYFKPDGFGGFYLVPEHYGPDVVTEMGKKAYTGIVSQWEVIKNCLGKLGLPWNNLYVSISTISPEFVIGAAENIFEKTFCINENWYTEDAINNSENCRTVLESILAPYGAFIVQDNANVIITDVNTVARGTFQPCQVYDGMTFEYVSVGTLGNDIGDLRDIGFSESPQTLNIVSAVNMQVIRYSPYKKVDLIDYSPIADFTKPSVKGPVIGLVPNNQWTETPYTNSYAWNKFGVNARLIELNTYPVEFGSNGAINHNNDQSYLSILSYGRNSSFAWDVTPERLSFKWKNPLPYIIPNAGYRLKIQMSAMFRTSDNLNMTDEGSTDMARGILCCKLTIGDKEAYCYKDPLFESAGNVAGLKGWKSFGGNIPLTNFKAPLNLYFYRYKGIDTSSLKRVTYTALENQWVDLQTYGLDFLNQPVVTDFTLPLDGFTGDMMTFEIYDYHCLAIGEGSGIGDQNANATENSMALKDRIKEVRIKDVKFTVVGWDGKDLVINDVEYTAYMNASFKNAGGDITLLQGTNKLRSPIEKASMMKRDELGVYSYIQNWTREGDTDCIENLLLRSIVSNYTQKTLELACTPNRLPYVIGSLRYEDYLAGKKFMVMGCVTDFKENRSNVTIQEISVDNLTIKKSF